MKKSEESMGIIASAFGFVGSMFFSSAASDSTPEISINSQQQLLCPLFKPTIHTDEKELIYKCIHLQYLIYNPPNDTHDTSDMLILQQEAQITVMINNLNKAQLAHSKLTAPDGDLKKFIEDWSEIEPYEDPFDYIITKDSYLPICNAYIEQSKKLNELILSIKNRYEAAGKNPHELLRQIAGKYGVEFEKSFMWLNLAVINKIFATSQDAENIFTALVNALNTTYVPLLPISSAFLQHAIANHYPQSIDAKLGGLKQKIQNINSSTMAKKMSENIRFNIKLTDPNLISGVIFDSGVLEQVANLQVVVSPSFKIQEFCFGPQYLFGLDKHRDLMHEECRCIVYENYLLNEYKQTMCFGTDAKKLNLAFEIVKIADVYDKLKERSRADLELSENKNTKINLAVSNVLSLAKEIMLEVLDAPETSKELKYKCQAGLERLSKKLDIYKANTGQAKFTLTT